MSDDGTLRYTLEEAFRGLRLILCERAGKELTIDRESRIDKVLAECVGAPADDLEEIGDFFYYSLSRDIEKYFRPDVTSSEWGKWLYGDATSPEDWLERIAPQRTMEQLAAVIVLRSRKIAFDPVTIFGRECEPAGAFCGMEQVALNLHPQLEQFAPSTPIRDRLRGSQLSDFWNRVRFCSGGHIPAVIDPNCDSHIAWRLANWMTLALLPLVILESVFWIGIVPLGLIADWLPWMGGTVLALVLVIRARMRLGRLFAYFSNPLPQGITTFRDLAELIVRRREAATAQA